MIYSKKILLTVVVTLMTSLGVTTFAQTTTKIDNNMTFTEMLETLISLGFIPQEKISLAEEVLRNNVATTSDSTTFLTLTAVKGGEPVLTASTTLRVGNTIAFTATPKEVKGKYGKDYSVAWFFDTVLDGACVVPVTDKGVFTLVCTPKEPGVSVTFAEFYEGKKVYRSNPIVVQVLGSSTASVTPIIKVLSPNGGEKYRRSEVIPMTWTQNYDSDNVVVTFYNNVSGDTYFTSTPLPAKQGSINTLLVANLPRVPTGEYRVTVCDGEQVNPAAPFKPLCDSSDEGFQIQASGSIPALISSLSQYSTSLGATTTVSLFGANLNDSQIVNLKGLSLDGTNYDLELSTSVVNPGAELTFVVPAIIKAGIYTLSVSEPSEAISNVVEFRIIAPTTPGGNNSGTLVTVCSNSTPYTEDCTQGNGDILASTTEGITDYNSCLAWCKTQGSAVGNTCNYNGQQSGPTIGYAKNGPGYPTAKGCWITAGTDVQSCSGLTGEPRTAACVEKIVMRGAPDNVASTASGFGEFIQMIRNLFR